MNSVLTKMSPSATKMIRMDHTHVLATFHQYQPGTSPERKKALVNMICMALEVHATLEEEIFYPAMRDAALDPEVLAKSVPEHDEMRRLISELRGMTPGDLRYDDTLAALMRDVMHHVADEETTLLPHAEQRLGQDALSELGAQMTKRRLALLAPRAGELAINTARTLPASTMMLAAGALLAGTYAMKRAFGTRSMM